MPELTLGIIGSGGFVFRNPPVFLDLILHDPYVEIASVFSGFIYHEVSGNREACLGISIGSSEWNRQ